MNWIKVKDELPPINDNDEWDIKSKISKRVLIYFKPEGEEPQYFNNVRFGTYNHFINSWSAEGYLGFKQDRLTHWMEIELPTY